MNAKHRSSSLVTHLFLRLHQPEAKYRTPFALATPCNVARRVSARGPNSLARLGPSFSPWSQVSGWEWLAPRET